MKEVLLNLANWHLIEFCKANDIDCSGSHVVKNGRGFTYSLVSDETGKAIVSLTFTKHSSPSYTHWKY